MSSKAWGWFSLVLLAAPYASWPAGTAAPPVSARIAQQRIDESQRIELKGHVHRAVRESADLGEAEPGLRADRIIMVLTGSASQNADLEEFLKDVQFPGSLSYHSWLTPSTFARHFGVAAADLAVIREWLVAKGFHIDAEPAGRRLLIFSGTVGQLNDAFRTRIHRYRWRGEDHLANSTNPSVPKAFKGVVAGFASLHDFRHRPQWMRARSSPQFTLGAAHYLAPGDFATIYDLSTVFARGITGAGRSIAVIGRSNIATVDMSNFRSAFGLSSTVPHVILNGPDPGLVPNDETESDLDLEWSGAVAPSASVSLVTSASTMLSDGVDLSSAYAVTNDLADVITVSYGACESRGDVSGGTTFYNQLWQQAAAQGTSVFVSSGDSGAAGCDPASSPSATHGLGVNLICSSPYSTCVGGSQFSADVASPGSYWSSSNAGTETSALSYIGESVWNESGTNLDASGGGASIYFAKPTWQLATGVPSDGLRDVPDVALNAAAQHDPYLIYSSDNKQGKSTLEGIGGTSASAPSMAGIAALVVQQQSGRVGNFNPVLYGLAQLHPSGGAQVFHSITAGNNSVPGQVGFSASPADPAYNQATGLGSIDGAQLLAQWTNYVPSGFGLEPVTAVLPPNATVESATLTLPSTTSWNAVVSGSGGWLAIQPTHGTGSTVLSFSATANSLPNARSGTITIAGQVLAVTQAAATAGSGNTAQASLSATQIGFGSDEVAEATSSQRVLISDTGNANLVLGSISLVGADATDFSESGSCVAGLALNPGSSCYVDIVFDPAAVGSRTATLLIDFSGGGSANVGLSGTGTASQGSDGPLPLWAYGLLSIALFAISARRQHRLAPRFM
jgi:pseudomonalisin